MSIFKRGNVYWYHFVFNGQHVQEPTKQGNPRVRSRAKVNRSRSEATLSLVAKLFNFVNGSSP